LDKNKNSKDVYSKDVLFWIKIVLNICGIFKHASTQTWRYVSRIRIRMVLDISPMQERNIWEENFKGLLFIQHKRHEDKTSSTTK
jgi:hypothetical protein